VSKHHLITDANGIPLACLLTGANRHDITQLHPLIEAIPPIRGKRGRPRRRPYALLADRGYDSQRHRQLLHARGIKSNIAKRNTAHGSRPGRERWVVERTLSWLHQYRRLRTRYERRADIHEAFLVLACSLICYCQLRAFC
jgi:transposase